MKLMKVKNNMKNMMNKEFQYDLEYELLMITFGGRSMTSSHEYIKFVVAMLTEAERNVLTIDKHRKRLDR
jgi:hypothetical protein